MDGAKNSSEGESMNYVYGIDWQTGKKKKRLRILVILVYLAGTANRVISVRCSYLLFYLMSVGTEDDDDDDEDAN